MNWSAKVVDTWNLAELVGSALGPVLIHCLVGPRAVLPDGALHRAALGHLDTVQGVAVGAEETGDEIVTAAELSTLGVHLLPPVLVVASAGRHSIRQRLALLIWLLALAQIQVVQGIHASFAVCGQSDHKIAILANRPTPSVHGAGPDRMLLPPVGNGALGHLAASGSIKVA